MKFREYAPHASLASTVKCFWSLERTYTPEDPVEEVLPDACVEMIFNFGAPYHLLAPGRPEREMPKAFLVGLHKAPLRYRCDGTVRIVATRFHAWGALPLLARDQRAPGTQHVALGPDWNETLDAAEALVLKGDYESAAARVEEHLIGRLVTATFDRSRIQAAAQILLREKGQVRISELAERCFLSVRQLQRQVQEATGLAPKALARTLRFDAARERLMFEPDTSLTALAHECGYADQAHFIRDFRAFANRTPGEFADDMRALQAVLRDHENVVFLRDQRQPPRR